MTPEQIAAMMAKRGVNPDGSRGLPTNPTDTPAAQSGPASPPPSRSPLDVFLAPAEGTQPPAAAPAAPVAASATPDYAALQNDLAAAHGRVLPLQQQLEEQRATLRAQQAAIDAANAELATFKSQQNMARAQDTFKDYDPLANLTPDQLAVLDPEAAEMIRASSRNAVQTVASHFESRFSEIDRRQEEAARQSVSAFVNRKGSDLGLDKLAVDPKFKQFLDDDDSAKFLLGSFVGSANVEAARSLAPRVKSMIARFEKTTSAASGHVPDPANVASSTQYLDRGFNGSASERSPDETRAILAQAKRLARSGKHAEAAKLTASLQ